MSDEVIEAPLEMRLGGMAEGIAVLANQDYAEVSQGDLWPAVRSLITRQRTSQVATDAAIRALLERIFHLEARLDELGKGDES